MRVSPFSRKHLHRLRTLEARESRFWGADNAAISLSSAAGSLRDFLPVTGSWPPTLYTNGYSRVPSLVRRDAARTKKRDESRSQGSPRTNFSNAEHLNGAWAWRNLLSLLLTLAFHDSADDRFSFPLSLSFSLFLPPSPSSPSPSPSLSLSLSLSLPLPLPPRARPRPPLLCSVLLLLFSLLPREFSLSYKSSHDRARPVPRRKGAFTSIRRNASKRAVASPLVQRASLVTHTEKFGRQRGRGGGGGRGGEGDKRDFINRVLHGDAEATRILIGLRGMGGGGGRRRVVGSACITRSNPRQNA